MTLTGRPLRPIVGAYNIPATLLATEGIPVHPSSALIRSRERADAMLASMGRSAVVLLTGHGLTAAGESVEQAVIRAVNVETLAKMQLSVLSVGATSPDIAESDRGDLPDLGSAFNDATVWRFHLAAIEHAGLSIRRPEEAK